MRRYSTQLALDSNDFGKSWERGGSWDNRKKTRCRRNVSQHCGIPANGLGRSKGPNGLSQLPNLSGPDRAVRLQPCPTSTSRAAVFPSYAQSFVWETCLSIPHTVRLRCSCVKCHARCSLLEQYLCGIDNSHQLPQWQAPQERLEVQWRIRSGKRWAICVQ